MKQSFAGLIVAIILSTQVFSQLSPEIEWQRTYGGVLYERGKCVKQTLDGGYIVAGHKWTYDRLSDFYLIKTDANGDTMWTRTYGGRMMDKAYSVIQTSDSGYVVTGYTESFGVSDKDIYVVKTNSLGDTLWTKTIGDYHNEHGHHVTQTPDGGYLISGYSSSYCTGINDAFLVKMNSAGDTLWTSRFGGRKGQVLRSALITNDGNIAAAGFYIRRTTPRYNDFDFYFAKTDTNGSVIWSHTFGGGEEEYAFSVQQLPDSGYILAGSARSFCAFGSDIYLVRTDSEGNSIWWETYGGMGDEGAYSVQQTSDGGFFIAGYTTSYGAGNVDFYLVKTSKNGTMLWSKTIGGVDGDKGFYAQQTPDGGFIIVGGTSSSGGGSGDVLLVKLAPERLLLEVSPVNPPIHVPPAGGAFNYNALFTNNYNQPITSDIWAIIEAPIIGAFQVFLRNDCSIPGNTSAIRTMEQMIPSSAPEGEYTYYVNIGNHPWVVDYYGCFTFTKDRATIERQICLSDDEWLCSGELTDSFSDKSDLEAADGVTLYSPSPNPFNQRAEITFSLLNAERIELCVYNILGRKAATLIDGFKQPGAHSVIWDAADCL